MPRTPRLARDAWRMGLCLLLGMVVTHAIMFGVLLLVARSGGRHALTDAVEGGTISVAAAGLSWLCFGVLYAVVTHLVFRRFRGDDLRRVASESATRSTSGRIAMLLLMGDEIVFPTVTVITSLVAVTVLVLFPSFTSNVTLIVGAIAGLVGGWLMMVVSFTTSYLREWARRDAVEFPEPAGEVGSGDRDRRYSDFVYLAVQFATTFASSDVRLVRPRVRMLASINSTLAFLFGTVIVGMFLSFAVSSGFAAA